MFINVNLVELKESCEMCDKFYLEFYSLLNEIFNYNVVFLLSNIYDEVLMCDFIIKSMVKFKMVVFKLFVVLFIIEYVFIFISGSRKRKSLVLVK